MKTMEINRPNASVTFGKRTRTLPKVAPPLNRTRQRAVVAHPRSPETSPRVRALRLEYAKRAPY